VAEPLTARFEFAFMGEERASFFRYWKGTEEKVMSLPAVVTSFGSRTGRRSSGLLHMNTLDYYVSKHGSLTVHCDIVVFDEFLAEEPVTLTTFMSVPPSDLHQHLGDLLKTKKGADVVFHVGRETFAAHRCVLAPGPRSSVLSSWAP
jgi:speckle-type POZ protein